MTLIPKEYDAELFRWLDSDLKRKIEERNVKTHCDRLELWNFILPPLHAMLSKVFLFASDDPDYKLPRDFPTKIKQSTALSTYLVRCFYNRYGCITNYKKIPFTVVATFISVALDDPDVTADKVAKIGRNIFS